MCVAIRCLILFALTAALAGLSWLTISTGVPTILRPLNLVLIIPLFLSDELPGGPYETAVTLLPPAIFLAWSGRLILRGDANVPARTHVLLGVFVLLSFLDFLADARYGAGYHGIAYTGGSGLISVAFWSSLVALAYAAEHRPSFLRNLGLHAVLFLWLAWYAMPYLGELP